MKPSNDGTVNAVSPGAVEHALGDRRIPDRRCSGDLAAHPLGNVAGTVRTRAQLGHCPQMRFSAGLGRSDPAGK
jgi:hypothetical protein